MRKYIKLIILSVVLVLLIALITLAMIYDVDLKLFKNLSIAGIQEKKMAVEELMAKQSTEEATNADAKTKLQTAKNDFDVAKETYENIDDSTIELVQEATKEENYFIEYLWIVLGNYATANDVDIDIITPGATVEKKTDDNNAEATATDNSEDNATITDMDGQMIESTQTQSANTGIKITIEGRYANVADFVFDVENDKSLRFKLDNINMKYAKNNKIQATFDVLSLAVLR